MSEPDATAATSAESEAMKHAWDWFSVHSAQRMQGINFFLVSIGFVMAGYGVAFTGGNFVVAVTAGILGVGLTYTFWMLDRRTRQLVKASETPLRIVEASIARRSGVDSIRIVEAVEDAPKRHLTYTQAFNVLLLLVFVLMLVAVGAALTELVAALELAPAPTPLPSQTP